MASSAPLPYCYSPQFLGHFNPISTTTNNPTSSNSCSPSPYSSYPNNCYRRRGHYRNLAAFSGNDFSNSLDTYICFLFFLLLFGNNSLSGAYFLPRWGFWDCWCFLLKIYDQFARLFCYCFKCFGFIRYGDENEEFCVCIELTYCCIVVLYMAVSVIQLLSSFWKKKKEVQRRIVRFDTNFCLRLCLSWESR